MGSTLLLEMDVSRREFPLRLLHSLLTRSSIPSSSCTTQTRLPSTRWLSTLSPRISLSVTRLTDGKYMTLMDMTLMLLTRLSLLLRLPTTESPSSSSVTPSSERVWKRLREPTLLTERLEYHT